MEAKQRSRGIMDQPTHYYRYANEAREAGLAATQLIHLANDGRLTPEQAKFTQERLGQIIAVLEAHKPKGFENHQFELTKALCQTVSLELPEQLSEEWFQELAAKVTDLIQELRVCRDYLLENRTRGKDAKQLAESLRRFEKAFESILPEELGPKY